MQRSWPNTARRTIRRAVTWRPKQPGDATLDIADLIRPFRYDVVIRAQLFDVIEAQRPAGHEVDDFALELLDHPYAVWYRDVELARFFPWILRDEELARRTYVRRVSQAVATFESVEERGSTPASR